MTNDLEIPDFVQVIGSL